MDLEKLDELEKKINQVALLLKKMDFNNEKFYEKKCIALIKKRKKWKINE